MPLTLHDHSAPATALSRTGRPARELWSLSGTAIHLNHGSYGAVPFATTRHQMSLIEHMNVAPGRWFSTLPSRVGAARERIATYLGADVQHTALVPNASAGISVVLQSLDLPQRADIVLTDHIYGAVRMAAERAVRRVAGTVTVVPTALDAADADVAEAVVGATSPRTALVIVDQITSATARVFPVAQIAQRLRTAGIPLLVDAAHAPGMLERPVEDSGADYWVGNLHKWACAPRGTAALVVSPRVADRLFPLIDSWGALDPYPQRFDMQGTTDLTSYLAAPHALDLIEEEFGWQTMREYSASLVSHGEAVVAGAFEAALDEPAFVTTSGSAPTMRLVELPDGLVTDADDAHVLSGVFARLGFETAVTSWRERGFVRLSAHLYNTADDYTRFAEAAAPVLVAVRAACRATGSGLDEAVHRALTDLPPTPEDPPDNRRNT